MLVNINYVSVFLYGLLIMVFLLDVKMDKKNIIAISAYAIFNLIFQFLLISLLGKSIFEKAYPFAVHLPLLIFCWLYFKKRLDSSFFTLFIAYILTTPRRWVGDLIALAFHNNHSISIIIQIIISIPLLIIVYIYLRPQINKVLVYSEVKIRFLLVIPFIYYAIAYLTTVYTQLLYTSKIVVIGILTIGLTLTFYFFFMVYFNEMEKRFQMTTEQNILSVQISALEARTTAMRQSEQAAILQRHDQRHHLHLINSYLEKGHVKEAQDYILDIENIMLHNTVVKYCENNAANLILSSYINMAKNTGIDVQAQIIIPQSCVIADMDLCIILANAFENAIHACQNIKDFKDRWIRIDCHVKNSKLFIQIVNSFTGVVTFKDDMPVTDLINHGFGTKSIAATVHKYNGICSFTTEEGLFKMSVIL